MPRKLKRVIRLDSMPLNQTFFTDEGYLMDRPILTSTGIFEYANADGSVRRELRLPEDVFDPESLKSYRGKPIIVTHDAGLITKNNVAENTIGTILSEGYRSGNDVRAEIVIHDADELKHSGYRELSLGYNLDLDETPGVYNGEPYDAIQRNIRINHLALVDEARAGEQARLNIDSRDKALKGGKLVKKPVKKKKNDARRVDSKKRRNDGILTPDELKRAVAEYKANRAARLAEKTDAEEEIVTKEEPVATPTKTPAKAATKTPAKIPAQPTVQTPDPVAAAEPAEIEEQVRQAKDRRDRRDEEGDPETLLAAEGIIADQDRDISLLFDIIDTLLAQIAFDEDDEEEAEDDETVAEDEDDVCGSEEVCEDEDDEETSGDEEDDLTEDEDDEEFSDEEDDLTEDEDDEETEEDDEKIPSATTSAVALNADSIDRIVRERVKIAKAAALLSMDGLESIKPLKAKRTIIRAVKPGVRLDGKSVAYVNAMFDMACAELQKCSRKDTMYQRRQMFNKDSRKASGSSTESARQKMIRRMQKSK